MNQQQLVSQLFTIRNQYGTGLADQKLNLLQKLRCEELKSYESINTCNNTLLFLMAYPDNKVVFDLAETRLNQLAAYLKGDENIRYRVFNSGITGTQVCAEYSFEMVKWLKAKYRENVYIESISEPTWQMKSILSVVLPLVESEIMQDENSTWQLWIKKCTADGEDLLDTLIAAFDQSPIRPEVKDELWTALAINVVVNINQHLHLLKNLTSVYYHKAFIKKANMEEHERDKPLKIKLSESEAEKVLECGRMILVRYLREIDPITFSSPSLISYYKLSRGLSIALFSMTINRRRPIDSYMAYVVFKNGLPISYGGSWVLFDSSRIAFNVFVPYRGGESLHTFEQILKAHKHAFRLKRFTADPYQIGKHNSDGIKSGAFWVYHKMGFRPIKQEQKLIAEAEAQKQLSIPHYRTPASVLNKLANSRLELILGKKPVSFDATDLSLVYFNLVKKYFNGNRAKAQSACYNKLIKILKLGKPEEDETIKHLLRNWCVILMADSSAFSANKQLSQTVKKVFSLKAKGSEEEYIRGLQPALPLRKFIEEIVKQYA
ncbi:MAG: hypothetical protein JWO06_1103 [Bacteroidota bacterium]|nr:hypothetical protein [Bacteroidota bacterium]